MKVVNGTSLIIRNKNIEILVTTLFYEDGRVIEKLGDGDWIEIKEADKTIGVVGKCKDCGEPVYEDQIYNYSTNERWVSHSAEEDCVKKGIEIVDPEEKPFKGAVGLHSVKPKDDDGDKSE